MTESVFSKIYSYRERENTNSKENFLIEIFANCLQADKLFRDNFLEKLDLQADSETTIKTQKSYEFGRPDIEINIPTKKTCILIECKIEHFERPNQLDDYKKILLSKSITKRHLVYLTKYYNLKEIYDKSVLFHLMKWADIFQIIDKKNTQLTNEFKSFLKEENMADSKNFNYSDLNVLTKITDTISKMNEVIDGITEYYENKICGLAKQSSRSTKIEREFSYATYHYVDVKSKFKSFVNIGFFWWSNEEVYIGTEIELTISDKYKETDNLFNVLKKNLKNWETVDSDGVLTIGRYEKLAKFIIENEEQIPEMVSYLKKTIDDLVVLKKIEKRIFQ